MGVISATIADVEVGIFVGIGSGVAEAGICVGEIMVVDVSGCSGIISDLGSCVDTPSSESTGFNETFDDPVSCMRFGFCFAWLRPKDKTITKKMIPIPAKAIAGIKALFPIVGDFEGG